VRGSDGLDEITLGGATVVYEADASGVRRMEITPQDFGLETSPLDELRGGSAEENAAIIKAVLSGTRRDGARDLVLMNAAASLHVAGRGATLDEAVKAAREAIDSGAALARLDALRLRSQA
jgi:anthranilate phosphoribosyltransferase